MAEELRFRTVLRMRAKAFTLIELVAVIVIMGILASVATVGFFSIRNQIADNNAKSLLTAVTAPQNTAYSSRGAFVTNLDSLSQVYTQNSVSDFVPADTAAGVDQVSIAAGESNTVAVFVAATVSASGTCFAAANFAPGSGEDIRIVALDDVAADACSAQAAIAAFDDITDPVTPDPSDQVVTAPANLRATAGLESVTVYWDPQPGATYALSRSVLSVNDSDQVLSSAASPPYNDTGLTAGVTYLYTLTTTFNATSETTGPVSATPYGDNGGADIDDPTDNPQPPTTPALSAAGQDSQVLLTWTTPNTFGASLEAYELRYATAGSSQWENLPSPSISDTSEVVDGLTNGQAYDFEIRAISSVGSSDYARVTATPRPASSAPQDLQATPSVFSVELSWSPPAQDAASVTGYEISFKPSASTVWQPGGTTAAGTTTGVVPALVSNTSYDFRVRATSAAGPSPWTPVVSVSTQPNAPGQVQGLQALGRDVGPVIYLSWEPEIKSQSYQVQMREVGAINWNTSPGTITDTAYTARLFNTPDGRFETVLEYEKAYEFRVRGVNDEGAGAWSDATIVDYDTYSASQPLNFTVQLVPQECSAPGVCLVRADLSWSSPARGNPLTAVQVEYKQQGQTWDQAVGGLQFSLPLSDGGAFVSNLNAGVTYDFRIRLTNTLPFWSPWAQTTASSAPLPAAPDLTVTKQPGTLSAFNFSWTMADNGVVIDKYVVAISTAENPEQTISGGSFDVLAPTQVTTWDSATHTNPYDNYQDYTVYVAAVDANGRMGAWSVGRPALSGLPPSVAPQVLAVCTSASQCPDELRNPGQPGANQFGMEVRVPPRGENLGSKAFKLAAQISTDGGATWSTYATANPLTGSAGPGDSANILDYLWVVGDPNAYTVSSPSGAVSVAYYASPPLASGTYQVRLVSSNRRGSSPPSAPFTVTIP